MRSPPGSKVKEHRRTWLVAGSGSGGMGLAVLPAVWDWLLCPKRLAGPNTVAGCGWRSVQRGCELGVEKKRLCCHRVLAVGSAVAQHTCILRCLTGSQHLCIAPVYSTVPRRNPQWMVTTKTIHIHNRTSQPTRRMVFATQSIDSFPPANTSPTKVHTHACTPTYAWMRACTHVRTHKTQAVRSSGYGRPVPAKPMATAVRKIRYGYV